MHAFRSEADEIPEIVMRGLGLGKSGIGFFLDRVNQIGKSDGVLDKEDRDVIAYQIPIAFLGIKFDGKAPHIAGQIKGPFAARHCGKSHKCRGFRSWSLEQISPRILRKRLIIFKVAVGTVASGMHHPFRNSFVVKMEDFLPEMEIFKGGWSPCSQFQRIMIVYNRSTLCSSQNGKAIFRGLMQFPAFSSQEGLVVNSRRFR